MKCGKRETKEEIELPNQENIRRIGEKENYLGILEAETIKQKEMKKRVPLKNEKTSEKQVLQQKSYQRNKVLGSPTCKILEIILKMDKRGTQTNRAKNKEIDDFALHTRNDIDGLYVPRKKKWGRCHNSRNTQKSKERQNCSCQLQQLKDKQ